MDIKIRACSTVSVEFPNQSTICSLKPIPLTAQPIATANRVIATAIKIPKTMPKNIFKTIYSPLLYYLEGQKTQV